MKELYEIGIVFRGFILVNHIFKELPEQGDQPKIEPYKDLRGAFISAINSFAESFFKSSSLEYLESGNILFVFKMAEIKPIDSTVIEPIIAYGLVDKMKKNSDKIVKRFLEQVQPILELFVQKYKEADFSKLDLFQPFKEDLIKFFSK